jgi:hypothetical protein
VIAGARVCAATALLALAACGEIDVVAYRALAACDAGGECTPPIDAGRDGGEGGDAGGDAGPTGPCAAATCESALSCAAPIPRAIVGDSCGDQPWVAPGFRHALCSCGDYVSEFPLTVQRALGSAEQGAASVAIDGTLTAGGRIDVAGAVYVAGDIDLEAQASLDAEPVQGQTGVARCDCSAEVVLVPDAVLALAPTNPSGFDAERFGSVETDETVPLPCGAYRVPRIAGPSGLNLTITGHVVLVVEGDIELDSNLEATLAEGALLELFVLGNMRVAGALILGDDDDDVRVYVLGSGTIDLNAEAFIAGPLYAPGAELVTRSDLTTTGSIFVRRAAPGGAVTIRYSSETAHATTCDP